jgi:hypothetical protein
MENDRADSDPFQIESEIAVELDELEPPLTRVKFVLPFVGYAVGDYHILPTEEAQQLIAKGLAVQE